MTDFAHPSLADLADHDEGLLADARSRAVTEHLQSCDVCAAATRALSAVRDTLAAEGSTTPQIPESVVATLDESLRRASAERAGGVSSVAERRAGSAPVSRTSSGWPRWALAATGAAAAVVLGYAGITVLGGVQGASDSARSSAADQPEVQNLAPDSGGAPHPSGGLGSGGATSTQAPSPQLPLRVLTPETLARYAKALVSTRAADTTTCGAVPVAPGARAARVSWQGASALVVADPSAHLARVYDCSAHPSVLFSTTF